jgi:hypothetical protein
MPRPYPLFAAILLALPPLTAQKVYEAVNEHPPASTYSMTGAAWFAHKRAHAGPVVLTAVEFLLVNYNGAPTVTLDVGIWDEEPGTGAPRSLLGSGSFTVPQHVPGWYGARLSVPATLPAAGNHFVAIRTPSAVVGFSRAGATPTPYWFGGPSNWTGPVSAGNLSFRTYAGTHAGASVTYGAGQAGSGAFVPRVVGVGWPNTTNSFGVRMQHGLGGAPCFLLLGTRGAVVLPFGTVYALPLLMVPMGAGGSGAGAGYAEARLVVPNDPALAGQRLAAQVFVVDAGAASGLSHTEGVEFAIGH